jgi:fucose permease
VVGICALLAILLFERLRPAYAGKIVPPPKLDLRARLALVTADRRIAMLALASMPFSAMQVSLNTVFVTLGTRELGLSHIEAGMALACAQVGGLVGRLGWGLVAVRLNASRGVLVVIGLGMAFCAALLGLDGASLGRSGQFAIAALFGLTASGWNGVFIAEIARLAPQDRIGETTGAVLTASYAGLLAAPALVSILDGAAGLGRAFFALACLALCGTLALIWGGHDKAKE